jgi:hypothetical protein
MAKSNSQIKIEYKISDGPITLEVIAGYATLGEFVLIYRHKSNYEFKEWGKDPKRVDDNINDIFIIPFDLQQLEDYRFSILGKYGPAPRSNQIKIDYIFIQKGIELHRSSIEEKTEEPFLRFTNRYLFIKKT